MLRSMTGFGKASDNFKSKKYTVELRSLNSKSLDLNMRMSSLYKELDTPIRKLISEKLSRGKVDFSMSVESIGDENALSINHNLAKTYYAELKSLNDALGESTPDYLSLILRMPEIYNTSNEELSDEEKSFIFQVVEQALESMNEFRRKEGEDLEAEFTARINDIRVALEAVPQFEDARIDTIRERMKKGLEEIQSGSYDDNRFEQEMIFYIEKLDISEEKMRLSNHLDYFTETMKIPDSGKKLGFISQEIGREINTLGSKSNHAEMQKLVIGMKDNLEKIKEQILNTL